MEPVTHFFRVLFFFLIGIFSLARAAEIGRLGEGPSELKGRIYAAIAAQAEQWKTLSSDFLQERHWQMLKNPSVITGRFFFEKPDRLYWEVMKPKPMGFSVQGRKVLRWTDDSKNAEALSADEDPLIRSLTEQIFFLVSG